MKYLYIILLCLVTSCCPQSNVKGKFLFRNMDVNIQDTLLVLSKKVLEEDYPAPELIDFSRNCILIEKKIGPWTYEQQIKDTVENKCILLPINTPSPYIVYKDFIYYPDKYNLYVLGFTDTSTFTRVLFKE